MHNSFEQNTDTISIVRSIFSHEAYDIITDDSKNSLLIDVRTETEWEYTGIPDLDNKKLLLIVWPIYSSAQEVIKFIETVNSHAHNKNDNILLMCKSGARSSVAAEILLSHGFTSVFNIKDGFEGNGINSGWKTKDLPWRAK